MNEDLFMEERRMRWRMMEAAKRERTKGKRIVVMNRELWAEGRRWNWDADGSCWKEEREMGREVGDEVEKGHAHRSDQEERIGRGCWGREESGNRIESNQKDAWKRGLKAERAWRARRGESG